MSENIYKPDRKKTTTKNSPFMPDRTSTLQTNLHFSISSAKSMCPSKKLQELLSKPVITLFVWRCIVPKLIVIHNIIEILRPFYASDEKLVKYK